MCIRLVRASVLALVLLSAGGLAANADDGRPPAPSGTGHPPASSAIPLTELRPSDIRTTPAPTIEPDFGGLAEPLRAPAPKKELVLFVGGVGPGGERTGGCARRAALPSHCLTRARSRRG